MLNWVLNRNAENARDAAGDTMQIEAPDTPAPIFAARAIRSALFGTPQRPSASATTVSTTAADDNDDDAMAMTVMSRATADTHTPTKPLPQGILLTPGTGTSKRKRVSFGRDVLSDNGSRTSLSSVGGAAGAGVGAGSSLWGSKRVSRRTRLTELLEGAKKKNNKKKTVGATAAKTDKADGNTRETTKETTTITDKKDARVEPKNDTRLEGGDPQLDDDDEGDEGDDDGWEEEEDETGADATTDMNEPHSRSGKFWKSEFERYRLQARTELETLIKYKKLAKSYAAKKDSEATALAEQLREEQERVIEMEKRITASASQIATRRLREPATGGGAADEADARRLSELTAEMVMYKERVQQLEPELARLMAERGDDLAEGRVGGVRRQRSSDSLNLASASPRTASTLLELQRELRRARAQVRENEQLRRQVKRLQSELEGANRRLARFEEDNKRLVGENASAGVKYQQLYQQLQQAQQLLQQQAQQQQQQQAQRDTSPAADMVCPLDLRTKLREAEDQCRQKGAEVALVRAEMEEIREESKARDAAKGEVIEKLRVKLNETKGRLRALQKGQGAGVGVTGVERPKSWAATERGVGGGGGFGGGEDDVGAVREGVGRHHTWAGTRTNTVNGFSSAALADKPTVELDRRAHRNRAHTATATSTSISANANFNNSRQPQPPPPNSRKPMATITASTYARDIPTSTDPLRAKFPPNLGLPSKSLLNPGRWQSRRLYEAGEEDADVDAYVSGGGLENDVLDGGGRARIIGQFESPRRAAALARIERRNLERRKSHTGVGVM